MQAETPKYLIRQVRIGMMKSVRHYRRAVRNTGNENQQVVLDYVHTNSLTGVSRRVEQRSSRWARAKLSVTGGGETRYRKTPLSSR